MGTISAGVDRSLCAALVMRRITFWVSDADTELLQRNVLSRTPRPDFEQRGPSRVSTLGGRELLAGRYRYSVQGCIHVLCGCRLSPKAGRRHARVGQLSLRRPSSALGRQLE